MLIHMPFSIALDFLFLGDTNLEGGFVNGICLSSHGALVSSDFVSLYKDGIGWYLHAFIDLHHVSH